MSALSSFPKSVNVEILTKWSATKDLIQFDTAICNTETRDYFLKLFQEPYFSFEQCSLYSQMSWFALRSVRCFAFNFKFGDYACFELEENQLLQFSHITKLSMSDLHGSFGNTYYLFLFLKSCTNLTS